MASPHSNHRFQLAHVIDVVRETPSTVTVVFGTDVPLSYRPGQYVQVVFRFGSGRYRRAYSLSSVPADDYPAITVKLVPGGKVSQHITGQLAIGDRFLVSAAQGDFLLPDSRAGKRFVLVAGGSGISPVMSLLRTLLAMPQPPRTVLLYYSRGADDIIFLERLQALAAQFPEVFELQAVVTGARGHWNGLHEAFSIDRVLAAGAGDPQAMYYVCGPESLIDTAVAGLQEAGIPAARVLAERFAQPPVRERPTGSHTVTFVHRGLLLPRRTRVRVQPGESLLDAAERQGLRARSNCRNGTCGACRATLVSGEVAMDEPNCLSLADARAGRVLTCISYPDSPVTVDLRG